MKKLSIFACYLLLFIMFTGCTETNKDPTETALLPELSNESVNSTGGNTECNSSEHETDDSSRITDSINILETTETQPDTDAVTDDPDNAIESGYIVEIGENYGVGGN